MNYINNKQYMRLLVFLMIFMSSAAHSKDYVVELFEEQYREQMIVGGGESQVYHTWQVKTIYGNKLLVLVGDDQAYRNWLRKYTGNHRLFVVKIPENGDDRFKFDRAVPLNIQQIHAVLDLKWSCDECRYGPPPAEPPPETP